MVRILAGVAQYGRSTPACGRGAERQPQRAGQVAVARAVIRNSTAPPCPATVLREETGIGVHTIASNPVKSAREHLHFDTGRTEMASEDTADGDWAGVRARLFDLGRDAGCVVSRSGEVLLESPMSTGDMEDLESWLGVGLPPDYREFLMQVTVGGAGPYDGLWPVLRSLAGGWEWASNPDDPVDRDLIAVPFPTLQMDDLTRMALCGAPPFEENLVDADAFQRAFDEWAERANAGVRARERTAGAVCIAAQNIDLRVWLIVTGPARGTIWLDRRDCYGEEDMFPACDHDGQPLTFRYWFLTWLTDTEAAS